jgi:hypothetical protein
VLEELVLILEDFAVMTNAIQKEAFSIGSVLPMIRGIIFYQAKLALIALYLRP